MRLLEKKSNIFFYTKNCLSSVFFGGIQERLTNYEKNELHCFMLLKNPDRKIYLNNQYSFTVSRVEIHFSLSASL